MIIRKLICLLSMVIMMGNTHIVNANDSNSIEKKLSASTCTYIKSNAQNQISKNTEAEAPYDTYIELEETDVNDIEIECKDIRIMDVKTVQNNGELNEIGMSEFDSTAVEDIGDASIDEEIVLGETAIPLYVTFNDAVSAMQNVKNDCPSILGLLAEKYDLDEMSESNWSQYYTYLTEYLDDEDKVDWYDENNSEFIELSSFFDIYENYKKNNELVSEAADVDSLEELVESDTFVAQLPSYAVEDLVEQNYISEDMIQSAKNSSSEIMPLNYVKSSNSKASSYNMELMAYSQSNAKKYAEKYAVKANKKKYGKLGSDCTNFVSQILVAGGKTPNSKWYCMKNIQSAGFSYSLPWCNANSFVNYWGLDMSIHSFKTFTSKLKAGDFITYDKEGDGDWDHMAYVTEKAPKYSSSLGYTDFKVAQHTKDYLEWTSSDKNGWETLIVGHPKIRFGVVRI